MFEADLCYIFIYIKRFLKLPACFQSHTKNENNFNLSMLLNKYVYLIFEKDTSKSNMTVSNNSQHRALHLSIKLNTGNISMLIPTHPILDVYVG